jgi:FSR family fosmidomycin resistance protein-like MFS transporter
MVELVDELASGAREAAWPSIQHDLGLSYFQIGLLIGAPALLSGVLEPLLGLLAGPSRRRSLVIAGGALFAASLMLTAASTGFWILLLSFVLFYPASGAFVNISQAQLMDRDPGRRDQNMARWTFAGSAGALAGPLVLGLSGTWAGWRGLYAVVGAASVAILLLAARAAFPAHGFPVSGATGATGATDAAVPADAADERPPTLITGLRALLTALRNGEVVRWLILLELANLMQDVLTGFLALYLVETASVTPTQAALAVSVWAGAGLLGDLLVIPLLEKAPPLLLLRVSAAAAAVLDPCFLLAGPLAWKLVLVALVGLLRSGWYAVLQARLYGSLPGQSSVSIAVTTLSGSAGALIPVGLGALAQSAGLAAAMWVLLAAPVALLIGLPRREGR